MKYDKDWIEEKTFDEHDDPYCVWKSKATHGKCGQTKAECDRCMAEHIKQTKYCDVYECEDCPRYGDDCDGDFDDERD